MKRYHDEQHIIERHFRERLRFARGTGKWQTQRGRYRKRDPYDCGNTRCGICHMDKRFGHQPTRQEMASSMAMSDK